MLVTILSNLFFSYQAYLKFAYVTAWGRTTTPPVQRLGLLGESVAIASFTKPVSRTKIIENMDQYCQCQRERFMGYSLDSFLKMPKMQETFSATPIPERGKDRRGISGLKFFQITKIIVIWTKPQNHKINQDSCWTL